MVRGKREKCSKKFKKYCHKFHELLKGDIKLVAKFISRIVSRPTPEIGKKVIYIYVYICTYLCM